MFWPTGCRGQRPDKGLPKQELPATMLSMDYTRVWYTDK